jgi:hypothetical protein
MEYLKELYNGRHKPFLQIVDYGGSEWKVENTQAYFDRPIKSFIVYSPVNFL